MEDAKRLLANAARTMSGPRRTESEFEVPEFDVSGFVDPKVRV